MEAQPQNQQDHSSRRYNYPVTDNINTISILHLVKGILTFIFSLFFLLYAFMGEIFSKISAEQNTDAPFDIAMLFYVIGGIGFMICLILGLLNILSYSYLKQRKNHGFIFAVSIINCLSGVLGIVLGIFTIIEINKPHIKESFK
jgi:hypothetical protein